MSAVTADKLAKIYVKIREARAELSKQDDALKEQLDAVAQQLLEVCKEQGATTIRTEYGTISRRTNTNYWTNDWDSFFKFLKENDAFSLMQHRLNNSNVKAFLEANPDVHPPGLNADTSYTIVITKR